MCICEKNVGIMLSGKCFNCMVVMLEGPGALCFRCLIMFLSYVGIMGGNGLSRLVMSTVI